MTEKSKRDGLTFVGSKRHAQANTVAMGNTRMKAKKVRTSHTLMQITYADGPLFDHYLTKKNDNTITLEQLIQTGDDDETGYIIEADLEFPRELHDKLKQFPPCPEAITP